MVLDANKGFAQGYNLALKQIEATYYVLLNSDVEVTDSWISPIVQLMDENPAIGACQPKILSFRNKNTFDYAGGAGGFIDILGYPFCRGRILNTIEKDQGQYEDIKKIFWASGACFFTRANIFHQLEGFDKKFFAHFEEIDLCWRMQQQGFEVYYHGGSCVYHIGGATLENFHYYKMYLNVRNHLLFLYKNATPKAFWWKFYLIFGLNMLFVIKKLFVSPKHSWTIIKAQIDFFLMKKHYQPLPYAKPLNTIYQGVLFLSYYCLWKKKFSSLKL